MYFSSCLASTSRASKTPRAPSNDPLRHDALPFAEQVGQVALVADRGHGHIVGDGELDPAVGKLPDAARLHQAADAHHLAGAGTFLALASDGE